MIHDSDRKTINCKICGKTYLTKRGLTVHWQTIHENVSFQCEKCDKVSKNMHWYTVQWVKHDVGWS